VSYNDPRIELVAEIIRPHLDSRCKTCAGTGVCPASGLDCTPCEGTGIPQGWSWATADDIALRVIEALDAQGEEHQLGAMRRNDRCAEGGPINPRINPADAPDQEHPPA